MHTFVCLCMSHVYTGSCGSQKGVRSLEVGITDICELPVVGAGNSTQVL